MQRLQDKAYSLLRRSEKLFKTDMVYVAKGGGWLLFGYGLQFITGTILAVSFANLLSKETYGFYQFALSMSAILSIFTLTGMGTAIIRSVARGEIGALRAGVRTELKWSLGITFASIITSIYYYLHGNVMLSIAALVISVTQPLITSFNLYKLHLQGEQRFKESVLVESLQRMLPFLVLLCALILTRNPLTLVITYFIVQATSSTLAYIYVIRRYRLPFKPNPEMTSYSKHLSIMESFSELAGAADKALVWIFLGAAPTAAYALAQLPVVHMQTIFGFLRQLAFPKLARKDFGELKEVLPGKIRAYSMTSVAVVITYILAAPFLFHLFFPNYPESIKYSQILALSILAVPRTLISQVFAAHQKKRELYIINIATPVARLIMLSVGLPLFGIWGAIGAVLISEWCAAIIQWRLFANLKVS